MPKVMKWQSPYTDEVYETGDPALAGRGNPPTCPDFSQQNPGMGTVEMQRIFVDVPDSELQATPDPAPTTEPDPAS